VGGIDSAGSAEHEEACGIVDNRRIARCRRREELREASEIVDDRVCRGRISQEEEVGGQRAARVGDGCRTCGAVGRERQGAQPRIQNRCVGRCALAGKGQAAKERVVRDVTMIGSAIVVEVDRAVAIVDDRGVIGGGVVLERQAAAGVGDVRRAGHGGGIERHVAAVVTDR
jgi:hypothetical protein